MKLKVVLNGSQMVAAPRSMQIKRRHLFLYLAIFAFAPVLILVLGRWIDQSLGLPAFPPFPINLFAGFTVFFVGLYTGVKATRTLIKLGGGLPWGELNGGSQAVRLVTSGPYAYSRNPMVLGYSFLPCGMGLMFRSVGMALFLTTVTLTLASVAAKFWEEPRLERRFGRAYLVYRQNTSFLIPRLGELLGGQKVRNDELCSR